MRRLSGAGRPGRSPLRAMVWAFHIALPVLGLWLLLRAPSLDVRWEHHAAHFWLVGLTALANLVLAVLMNRESQRRGDARLFLVSLAFASSAGFLALHAAATPGLLLDRNAGFQVATPVGLAVASVFAFWSSLPLDDARGAAVLRRRVALRLLVGVVLGGWLAVSLLRLPPLDRPVPPTELHGPTVALAVGGVVLYLVAAARYYALYRRRPSVMLISVITAFFLLAESLVIVAYGRNWQLSWWEWHLVMAGGFAFVAYSAAVQWSVEGSAKALFGGIALEQTLRDVREDYARVLEALVARMEEEEPDAAAVGRAAAALQQRFDVTERQVDVLVRAAEALAAERDVIRRQGALVAVGQEASVIRPEDELLTRVLSVTRAAFGSDVVRVALLHDGRLLPDAPHRRSAEAALDALAPVEDGDVFVLPLVVKGHGAGVVAVERTRGGFAERDRALLRSFASQLSIALENARLYHQIDALFRSYMSPDVATSLLADPQQAALGGASREITVLMADLRGFTPFSERSSPERVIEMLNTYFAAFVPIVLEHGGTITTYVGDALMAMFNAPTRQHDHALRAARAGLAAQVATGEIAASREDWPRFRVGINTGPAVVGNVGAEKLRSYTAIGDTVNLAARLESAAGVGEVVVSAATLAALGDAAEWEPLGALTVKGKSAPVEAFRLVGLREDAVPAVSRP